MLKRLLLVLLLVSPLAACDAGAPAATPTPTALPATPTPTGPALTDVLAHTVLTDLIMPSRDEGWAVGAPADGLGGDGTILHYQSGTWHVVASPPPGALFAVGAGRAGDVWAAGERRILHYQGGQWTSVPNPSAATLRSLTVAPDGTVWGVGSGASLSSSTVISGTQNGWSLGSLLLGEAAGITIAPDGTVWAVGRPAGSLGATGIAYKRSGGWNIAPDVALLMLRQLPLRRIQMVSNTEGWAAGGGTILHYQDGKWETVAQLKADLYGLALSPTGDTGWAVGSAGAIFQYKAGQWTEAPSPTDLGLSQVAWMSADEAWAVGGQGAYNAHGILLHYTQGAWSVYQP
ncbi:MAG: hypothetical protein M3Z04_13905 [Chloroflexota bacterium]|nr:hypothetical protein [Chloroflexota bacterium]